MKNKSSVFIWFSTIRIVSDSLEHVYKNKLSKYKIEKIIECSCIDIDASKTAQLLKLNRKTINRYFNTFRTLIYQHQYSEKEQFVGIIEVDENFFGPARLRGKLGPRRRGRGP